MLEAVIVFVTLVTILVGSWWLSYQVLVVNTLKFLLLFVLMICTLVAMTLGMLMYRANRRRMLTR